MDPPFSCAGVSLFRSRGGAVLEEMKASGREERGEEEEKETVKMGFSLPPSRSASRLSLFYTALHPIISSPSFFTDTDSNRIRKSGAPPPPPAPPSTPFFPETVSMVDDCAHTDEQTANTTKQDQEYTQKHTFLTLDTSN